MTELHDTRVSEVANQQYEAYIRQPRELISHANREASALNGYRGRQVLELLQNADDAGAGLPEGCKVRFDLTRERLIVANSGVTFSYDGLMSLVISDCSPKQLDQNRFIGCKGLGFRAVLTWTSQPSISSGILEVQFDKERATTAVEKLSETVKANRS
jgi:hypothetical protein